MLKRLCLAAVFLVSALVADASVTEGDYPVLTFKNAWKCKRKSSVGNEAVAWTPKIQAPPEKIKLERDLSKRPGCYRIRMMMLVNEEINEPFQMRLRVHLGTSKGPTLPCSRTEKEAAHCKGGVGSCIYCGLCGDINKEHVQLDGFNQTLRCPLQRGWHTLSYSICLPDNNGLQKLIPDDIKSLLEIIDGQESTQDMFIRIELYDTDIAKMCGTYYDAQKCHANAAVAKQTIGCAVVYATMKAKLRKPNAAPPRAAATRRTEGKQTA